MARKESWPEPLIENIAEQAVGMRDVAEGALADARRLGIENTVIDPFLLTDFEQGIAAQLIAGLSADLKKKLIDQDADFTIADTADILSHLANSMFEREPLKLLNLFFIAKKLIDLLDANVPILEVEASEPKPIVYQFKITLIGSKPPIWRRIQVKDCTLDMLHEHIQAAMGWDNTHLHQFRIGKQFFSDPALMKNDFDEMDTEDSTTVLLSDLIPERSRKFRFIYEYDFGDSWEHEIVLEKRLPIDPKTKYPLCLKGARASPPDDCGGIWGYANLIAATKDKAHERHEESLEWLGDPFDPEEFDAAATTKAMRKGMSD
jgi:hypothetical protein